MVVRSNLHPAVATDLRIGIRPTLWLASCGDAKLDHAAPARELYSGDLTRKQIAFASTRGSSIDGPAACMIVSAKHGLVDLDETIEPYEARLTKLSKGELADWRAMIIEQLADAGCLGATIFVMAGAPYERALRAAVDGTDTRVIAYFGSSMEIGQRRSLLRRIAAHEALPQIDWDA